MSSQARRGPGQGAPPTERPKTLGLDEKGLTESIIPAGREMDSHFSDLRPPQRGSGMFTKSGEGEDGGLKPVVLEGDDELAAAYLNQRKFPGAGAVPDIGDDTGKEAFPDKETPTMPNFAIPRLGTDLMEPDYDEDTKQMRAIDLPADIFQPPEDIASEPAASDGGPGMAASLEDSLRVLSEGRKPGVGLSQVLGKGARTGPATAEECLGILRDHLLMVVERRARDAFKYIPGVLSRVHAPAVADLVISTAYLKNAPHQVIQELDEQGQNGCVRIEGMEGRSFMLFINPNRNPSFEGLGSKKGRMRPDMAGMSLKSMAIINCGETLFCLFPVDKS